MSKILNGWQTFNILIIRYVLQHLIWVYIVFSCTSVCILRLNSIFKILNLIPYKTKFAGVSPFSYLFIYSRLSLFRPRLSRITAYLEVKSGPCFNTDIYQQATKYCGKEEKLLLRSNFSSFPQYFQYISNLGVKLHISFC